MMQDIATFLRKFVSEISNDEKDKVYAEISSGSSPSNDFFIMSLIAVTITTLGLLTNSAVTIIGAMLVSPLLTPVIGIALGVIKGDLGLFWKGFEAEAKGIALALGVAILITLLLPNTTITNEILARTRPTPLDLLVALASGAAAAYALCRKNISAALPGVAIAVAVMPPLSVVGIGIALKKPEIALGGALMFAANVIAIDVAASLVFWLMGFSPKMSLIAEKETVRRLKTSAALLLLILLPLGWIMWESISASNTKATIERVLSAQIEGIEQAKLADFGYEWKNGAIRVYATVDSPRIISMEKANEMRIALEKNLGVPVDFDLKVNEVKWIRSERSRAV